MTRWYGNVPAPTDKYGSVVPLDTKKLVNKGETLDVYGFFYNVRLEDWFVEFMDGYSIRIGACTLPDSWEKLEEDARKTPREYTEKLGVIVGNDGRVAAMARDLVRRAKRLAGIEEQPEEEK